MSPGPGAEKERSKCSHWGHGVKSKPTPHLAPKSHTCWAVVVQAYNLISERGRRIMSSRPVWATEQIQGQLGQLGDNLSQNKK